MSKQRYRGRKWILWGSLLLIIASGFDFYTRFETLWWAIQGVYNLSVHEGIPFARALSYFDPSMAQRLALLLTSALLGLVALALRNRPLAGYGLIPVTAGLGWYAFMQEGFFPITLPGWAHALQWIPMAAIAAGCIVNLAQYYLMRRKAKESAKPARKPGEFRRAPLSTFSAEKDERNAS